MLPKNTWLLALIDSNHTHTHTPKKNKKIKLYKHTQIYIYIYIYKYIWNRCWKWLSFQVSLAMYRSVRHRAGAGFTAGHWPTIPATHPTQPYTPHTPAQTHTHPHTRTHTDTHGHTRTQAGSLTSVCLSHVSLLSACYLSLTRSNNFNWSDAFIDSAAMIHFQK